MNRKTKLILAGLAMIAGMLVIGNMMLSNFYLNRALRKIDKVQGDLDKTVNALQFSKSKIDTMQRELSAYRLFIKDIQGRVEIMDLENRKSQLRFTQKRETIKNRLDSLYKKYGITNPQVEIVEL